MNINHSKNLLQWWVHKNSKLNAAVPTLMTLALVFNRSRRSPELKITTPFASLLFNTDMTLHKIIHITPLQCFCRNIFRVYENLAICELCALRTYTVLTQTLQKHLVYHVSEWKKDRISKRTFGVTVRLTVVIVRVIKDTQKAAEKALIVEMVNGCFLWTTVPPLDPHHHE